LLGPEKDIITSDFTCLSVGNLNQFASEVNSTQTLLLNDLQTYVTEFETQVDHAGQVLEVYQDQNLKIERKRVKGTQNNIAS